MKKQPKQLTYNKEPVFDIIKRVRASTDDKLIDFCNDLFWSMHSQDPRSLEEQLMFSELLTRFEGLSYEQKQ